MNKKKTFIGIFSFIVILFLFGCGLEDYPRLYPIPQSNVSTSFASKAIVRIPNENTPPPFSHFVIFYRVYRTAAPNESPGPANFNEINSVLNTDYNAVRPMIDSDTIVNTNMDTFFSGRGYKYLQISGANIDSVLSASVLGKTLEFDFPGNISNGLPTMKIDSTEYTLLRSNGNGTFTPRPADRLFVNESDLRAAEYLNDQFNADVERSNTTDTFPYTYAAMFIAAVGINPSSYSYIYSTPTLIHVFELTGP